MEAIFFRESRDGGHRSDLTGGPYDRDRLSCRARHPPRIGAADARATPDGHIECGIEV